MTTLRILNLVCPHCQNKMYFIGVMSYTIHNSESFSDGKTDSFPTIPKMNTILICSSCHEAFWKDDALLENENNVNILDELPEATSVTDLFPGFKSDNKRKLANYYSQLLDKKFAKTTTREIYLRIELWHTLNDGIRYKKEATIENKDMLFKSNLIRLIEIFKPELEEEQLFLVEMHRELREFDKALLLLGGFKNNSLAYKKITEAVKRKESKVFKII